MTAADPQPSKRDSSDRSAEGRWGRHAPEPANGSLRPAPIGPGEETAAVLSPPPAPGGAGGAMAAGGAFAPQRHPPLLSPGSLLPPQDAGRDQARASDYQGVRSRPGRTP